MIKNYLVMSFRRLLKHKMFSTINIVGLSIGLAACLMIAVFVIDELRYDTHHSKADRTYRISRQWFNQNGESSLHLGHIAISFIPALRSDFPEMIETLGNAINDNPLLIVGEKNFVEDRFFYGEPQLFDIFTWPLRSGDLRTFGEPNTVVVTRDMARKYFGEEDAVGRIIRNESERIDLKVIAVAENPSARTHFRWDFMCSFATFEALVGPDYFVNNFGGNNHSTYAILKKGVSPGSLEALLPSFVDRHVISRNLPPGVKMSERTRLNLWPLTSIHLHSHLDSEIEPNSDIRLVYIYMAIAGFILLIACINFMNLSTARATDRAREVGIRKVVGADRAVLIRQFIGEAMVLVVVALIGAVGLVEVALPWFNAFAGRSLELSFTGDWLLLVTLAAIAVVVGIGAGSYPAFYLSAFRPVQVLKGVIATNKLETAFRSILVVFQFAISIALMVCVGMIHRQLQFMQNKDMGFDKTNIILMSVSPEMAANLQSIKERLLAEPAIESVSFSSRVPSGRILDSQNAEAEVDGDMRKIEIRIADIHVDHDFMSVYRVPFAAGRDFDIRLTSDSTEAFVLNESAVAAIGWNNPQDAVGKKFKYGTREGRIIGVVKDFHFESLHQEIAPLVFLIPSGRIRALSVRIHSGSEKQALAFLNGQWNEWKPRFPFSYAFIDENFRTQYRSEERLGEIVGYFAGLAVVVASMGLFALATFSAQKRTKEIGIRKVLGASPSRLALMLSADFTRFVVIANGVAWPAAYFACTAWLELFPYHVSMDWLLFVGAGLAALVVALVTVSYHALKTAMSNPVTALKYE